MSACYLFDVHDANEGDDEPIATIRRAEETIRGLISCPPRQPQLLPDERRWSMICSALDVIGDTESAIRWYETHRDPSLRGGAYLIIYGVLQTLYLQQDAVRHIFEALELSFQPPETLRRIRQIRNETVGHPTNIGRGHAFVFVVQMTVGVNGFEYHKHGADGSFSSHDVDLRELVRLQREAVLELLLVVCRALREEWWQHMKRFSETKLAAMLPETWGYFVEKTSQSIEGQHDHAFGNLHVRLLMEAVGNVEAELRERHDQVDGPGLTLADLQHALMRLQEYFTGGGCTTEDARVFLSFAAAQLDVLEKRLNDLDNEYEDAAARR